MSRAKSLKSLSDWIGAGGHSFGGSLMNGAGDANDLRQIDLDQLVAGRYQPRRPWLFLPLVSWVLRLLPPLPDCLFDFGAPRLATASVKL